ncbi:hypothetical protein GLIP_4244 [Aliiglaciecola lipolytica E3]|uniref:Potassium channel domain-containing protein n=2 Tax=Aliiglaciecola TaxID=1406885 RepID=K6Z082_9ALTE|nr:hypothetical protein GLIP_4244 [Aliiglaciecola lipolytica E3]
MILMPELYQQLMALFLQLLIALVAVIACAMSHYRILQFLERRIMNAFTGAYGLIVLFCGITVSQLFAALWFTFAFQASITMDLGNVSGGTLNPFIELFYYSIINLTTLGLGQIEASDHLRFLAGVEAMTGFLLVSCSASVLIRYMKH